MSKLEIGKPLREMFDRCLNTDKGSAHYFVYITKPELRAMQRVVARLNKDVEYHHRLEQEHGEALDKFNVLCEQGRILIDREWEYEGVAWLWVNRKPLKFGEAEFKVLRNFSYFTLGGFHVARGAVRCVTCPIWRVHGWVLNTKRSFSYVAWPWQSGLKPYVLGGDLVEEWGPRKENGKPIGPQNGDRALHSR